MKILSFLHVYRGYFSRGFISCTPVKMKVLYYFYRCTYNKIIVVAITDQTFNKVNLLLFQAIKEIYSIYQCVWALRVNLLWKAMDRLQKTNLLATNKDSLIRTDAQLTPCHFPEQICSQGNVPAEEGRDGQMHNQQKEHTQTETGSKWTATRMKWGGVKVQDSQHSSA